MFDYKISIFWKISTIALALGSKYERTEVLNAFTGVSEAEHASTVVMINAITEVVSSGHLAKIECWIQFFKV